VRERIKKAAAAAVKEIGLREVFLFAGLASLAYGLHQVYPPAAWIAVGVLLMRLALPKARAE